MSVRFAGRLFMVDNDNGTKQLIHPLDYFTAVTTPGRWIRVPLGFVTDFASVPIGFRNIISPDGNHNRAAVVHDYLYSRYGRREGISRAAADAIFYEAMLDLGVSKLKAWTMWSAVRVGGWIPWRKETP